MRAHDLTPAIRHALTGADYAQARTLFEEYAAWLGVDLCFQDFADELKGLPGDYAPPRGRLLLAGPPDATVGCIALRPLSVAGAPEGSVGEVKRMYVRPEGRGAGVGRALAVALIDEARAIGYRELMLDTLDRLADARRLYARLGFVERSPYYHNPLPGVVYMALRL
ncbi:MAG: GNAT family N-acetyltransferase [Burkholderiales bacterium]